MDDVIVSSSSEKEKSSSFPSPLPPPPPKEKARGGWRSVKYILGNESFEKLASMGLIANLTVYLQTKYNLEGVQLVNVYNIWSGTSNVTPLIGAFLSDAYLGRYRTLLFGSISSFLGMGTMALTASIPQFRPRDCNGGSDCQDPLGWQFAILYIGLGLLAIGAGGIRPCNIAFGADQFDTRTEKGRKQLESFFNWWYLSFTVALVIALTVVVYVQSNVSWVVGYVIPTACLFISISLFVIGKLTYIMAKPQGSAFVDVAKVIVAASKKRNLSPSFHALYDPPVIESEQQVAKLSRTSVFMCLDKGAMIADPSELDDQGLPKDSWRLCSVQQVEQLKLLLGVFPVWLTGIGCFITMDQMNTFGLMQALQCNNIIHNFNVPPGWMGLTSMIALSIWILIYEKVYLPQAKKRSKEKEAKRMTMRQRINTGIVMAILCMTIAANVEKKRRDSALKHGSFKSPLSILVLLPQFALSGLTEAFSAVATMEYLTMHLPESMRTVAGAIFFFSLSVASYLNTALVNIVHSTTGRNGKSPWLGGRDLNKVRLDYFFYIVAGIAMVNLVYFNVFSYRFLGKKIDEKSNPEEQKVVETA